MTKAKGEKIFNPITWEKVNNENKMILDDYVLEMKSKGRSKGTIYQYSSDIRMFYCWVYDHAKNKTVTELKKRDFRRFFLEMEGRGTSAARINRAQCSLRNLLEFVAGDDDEYEDYEVNAMKAVKGLSKEAVRDIHFVKNEHVEAMLDNLISKGKYQLALYLSLSYESAGRRNEIYQVQKHGFLENNRTNEVVGKRGKKFKLLYFNRSREIAKLYFEQRGEDDIDSVWTIGSGENKRPAEYSTLYGWAVSLRKYLEEVSGEFVEINAHTWRHSSLEAYENGSHYVLKELGKEKLPLEVLKVLANHTSIETTASYLMNKDDELLNEAFGL